mmetsp:Transcript_43510/g.136477  ORF Transcript_43510/g.136477 Transcript_43510/m.136477 type:complete len:240 (-) Transcript_43510:1231-1950(-)
MSSASSSPGWRLSRRHTSVVPASTSKLSSGSRMDDSRSRSLPPELRPDRSDRRLLRTPRTFLASCLRSSDQRALSSGERRTFLHTSGRDTRRVFDFGDGPDPWCSATTGVVCGVGGKGGTLSSFSGTGGVPLLIPMMVPMLVSVSAPRLIASPMTPVSPSGSSAPDGVVATVASSMPSRKAGAPKRWCKKLATSTKSSSSATSKVTRHGHRARVLKAWWSPGVILSTRAQASEDLHSGR